MDPPPTRYIDRDGAALAYQVFGSGTGDALFFHEIGAHLDLVWTDPYMHAQMERVASRARLAAMQRRGVGLSEPIGYVPTIEQQADDVLAVMDAAGLQKATLGATLSTCAAVALVAARSPDRVRNLLLVLPFAAGPLAEGAAEAGFAPGDAGPLIAEFTRIVDEWGSGGSVALWNRSLATPYNRRLFGMLERCSAAPSTARRYLDWVLTASFADIFKAIPVPTTVISVDSDLWPFRLIQAVVDMIDNVELVRLDDVPQGTSLGESWQPIWDRLTEMTTGTVAAADLGRFLGAVMFTDVVDSTRLLTEIGDARYRELRDAHERQVRLQVERDGGRLVNVIGDGTFSLFDSPSRAVQSARAICAQAADLGISVRAGVHSGELERTSGHDITGLTVHVGARVAGAAKAGQVLVSRTVYDLALGSGLQFVACGEHQLKGVPGTWELFSVGDTPATVPPADAPTPTVMDRAALRMAQRAPRLARTAVSAGNAWQRRRARAHANRRFADDESG